MKQSASLHVAIIMDGNGRWAAQRGLPRVAGHRAGAEAAERIVEAAPRLGIGVLTLFAFSSDNWSRPMPEVTALMRLFRRSLQSQRDRAVANGVAFSVIGRRDRLPVALLEEIARTEAATAAGATLLLRLAVDYSARDALYRAALRLAEEPGGAGERRGGAPPSRERFEACLARVDHGRTGVPPVDVLIRTGGEQRLSDFLLWESAYAELFFRDTRWPDFMLAELDAVLAEFRTRERRFGGIPPVSAAARAPHLRLTR